MTVHIIVGGRTRAVDVSRDGERFLVSMDGREHAVDVKVIDEVWSLLVAASPSALDLAASGVGPGALKLGTSEGRSRPYRSYEVAFSAAADGAIAVHVDGIPVEVSINQQARRRATTADRRDAGPQQVRAPMPGKVVKLLVKPGDVVQPRQGIVVVEAMKMENELRARAAGTVREVRVIEGSSVEAGAILVVLE